uniref:Uncharacterized protein n=1 Tax=Podoviridae sp. ctaNW81 TaxID=2826562 RepID=A0A8S5M563_9CAUD|nr:MAG TPA: hypothetical protein [Podoviridae sp. ctaNW81]
MEDTTVKENTINLPAHTIVTLSHRDRIYTTYTDWVRKHAECYFNEYYCTDYSNYFNKEPDILTVLCSGIHSQENPITLCLCRSLTTDRLVLVGAENITYNKLSKEIYAVIEASSLYNIFTILQEKLPNVDDNQLQDVAKALYKANLVRTKL